MDTRELLNSAERHFLNRDYNTAIKLYSIILSCENDVEAEIGVILSDFGLDYPDDAQVLYYYYQSKKSLNR